MALKDREKTRTLLILPLFVILTSNHKQARGQLPQEHYPPPHVSTSQQNQHSPRSDAGTHFHGLLLFEGTYLTAVVLRGVKPWLQREQYSNALTGRAAAASFIRITHRFLQRDYPFTSILFPFYLLHFEIWVLLFRSNHGKLFLLVERFPAVHGRAAITRNPSWQKIVPRGVRLPRHSPTKNATLIRR